MSVPMNGNETVWITAEGYELRRRELDALRNQARWELGERFRQARQDGGFADNPALQDLLEEQAQLEQRIARLEGRLSAAKIVAPAGKGLAGIGSIVRVRDADGATSEYELVGPLESDVGNGRVSIVAPVGQALLGSRAGDPIEVATPRGPVPLEVISVRTKTSVTKKAA